MSLPSSYANGQWISQMVDEYYRLRPLMCEDYYILANPADYTVKNSAHMYIRQSDGNGFIMAFRAAASDTDVQTFILKGLDPDTVYLLEDADTGENFAATGEALMSDGVYLTFSSPGATRLIYITPAEQ